MNHRNAYKAIIILVALAFLTGFIFWCQKSSVSLVHIKNTDIQIDFARTKEARERGLSGREGLDRDAGLWFALLGEKENGIWMKEMKFPIDIIWTDDVYHIIDVKENARPDSYPEIFYPRAEASHVLEVNAGFVGEHQIEIGDTFSFPKERP